MDIAGGRIYYGGWRRGKGRRQLIDAKNMNIKKYIVITSAVLMLAGSGAFAQEAVTVMVKPNLPMVLEIGPGGRALLRGTVSVAGANSLTVKSWGGDWVVNVGTSTKLAPRTDIAQFQVGDFVGVHGIASQSASWTIDATLVRNWTERKEARQEMKDNKKEVKDLIKSVAPRNWEGVASNVNLEAKTLTLTVDGTAYAVVLASGAKIVNEKFAVIDFSLLKNGDKIRVHGPLADTTITAVVVRDVSVR